METPKAIDQSQKSIYSNNRKYPKPKEETLKRTMARYIISRRGVEKKRTPLNEILSGLTPRPIMRKIIYEDKIKYNLN